MVILDSAVSYCMGKVDFCLEGAESVCESGGLVNYVSFLPPHLIRTDIDKQFENLDWWVSDGRGC